ncbi:MAG: hypothetical protein ACXWFI_14710 [Methylobacter sp.]
MTLLNKIIIWQLENFLNEKHWEFSLECGYESFLEKANNEVTLIGKKNPSIKYTPIPIKKDFYGYIENDELILELTKEKSRLNFLKITYFYFSGKIYAKENILKGSFHMQNHFRFMDLFFLNAFFIQSISYILYLLYKFLLTGSLITNFDFYLIEIGFFILLVIITIESKIHRFYSRHEEEQIYKLLVYLTGFVE